MSDRTGLDITVPCAYCQTPTRMDSTKVCDDCWEIKTRVERAVAVKPVALRTILRKAGALPK